LTESSRRLKANTMEKGETEKKEEEKSGVWVSTFSIGKGALFERRGARRRGRQPPKKGSISLWIKKWQRALRLVVVTWLMTEGRG